MKSYTRLHRRIKYMSSLALITNVTCGHCKICNLSQEAKLGFNICCGEKEANSSSAGLFQMNSVSDSAQDKMPRKTVRTRHLCSTETENSFLASKQLISSSC